MTRNSAVPAATGRRVAPRRRRDHRRRAVDGGVAPAVEALEDERGRDAVPAADLEHAVPRAQGELVDDPPEAIGHGRECAGPHAQPAGPPAVPAA
jgi:hypothetical protein